MIDGISNKKRPHAQQAGDLSSDHSNQTDNQDAQNWQKNKKHTEESSEFRARTQHSLHLKLLRILAYALALAILVSGFFLLIIGQQSTKQNIRQDLIIIGEILAEKTAFQLSLGYDYADEVYETLSSARHHNDISRVCLYNEKGDFYASFVARNNILRCKRTYTPMPDTQTNSGKHTSVMLPISLQGSVVGTLTIESSGLALKQSLYLMATAIFGTLFGSVVLALFISNRQLKNSLIPLNRLSTTGKNIAKNPYSHERAKKSENDEVGELVDVFNHMLDVLDLENQKLVTSENTFRSLSENAPVGVFLRHNPNDFHYVNSTWSKITGLSIEEANAFSRCISSEYKRIYIENIAKLTNEKSFVSTEFEYIQPNGECRFLQEFVSVVKEKNRSYYVGSLLDVTELKDTQIELEKLAFYDPLTNLPNRRYLSDHLQFAFASAEKKGTKIAAFMTDLDNFKRVNDTLGHDAGDKLLQQIGTRLRNAVFREDIVTRMGGDEFLVLVEGIENLNSVEFISNRLLNAMNTSADYERTSIPVTGSVGVAMYPDDADTPEELLRFADMALYNSKDTSGNCFSCYSSDLDAAIRSQVRIEQKLRQALEQNIIEVYLQPQYSADTRTACWAEALVRWFDKEDGYIPPDKFIGIAEDTGLIHQLGDRVLERVCQIISQESDTLDTLGIQGISVNLSATQFFSKELGASIENLFSQYSIKPQMVEFELTESTVTDDMEHAVEVMDRLRKIGCRLSMDDFGTGYSSLSYLTKFPMTSLKIDQAFVRHIPDNKNDCDITCTIINLAHSLGMSVVAEGVETQAQATFLSDNGCEYLQGYFLSRPASMQELTHRAAQSATAKKKRRASVHPKG